MAGARICTVVLVYNVRCQDSAACRALAAMGRRDVLVVDNSTKDLPNGAYCQKRGWQYAAMGGNFGLARAYNRATALLLDACDYIVWLDDDTQLTEDYFAALETATRRQGGVDIFLPLVHDEAGLLSPSAIRGNKVWRVARPEDIGPGEITGINSGMAVRTELYRDHRYDEGYFLDYIDHAFLRDMKAGGAVIAVLDAVLQQRFFGNQRGDVAAAARRFAIFRKDFARFCGRGPGGRLYAAYGILRHGAGLVLKNRSLGVLFGGRG
ncbi:glycosyltransferase [Neobittarella massiliensis]|uniref:glycosyltransferase n=1 Tax=Neobittarella massiliensis (ex Bilen et al. 2018) TaxID=2041842 RepID=UPI000CF65E5B|nr:glycosyltransferase [Neobittarella massiliensis]